ncbi:MAG: hypothetical protein WDN44_01225 [Sphingomonas sp.]
MKLEKADTFTVGGVIQPDWIPNFKLSIDYYNITVDGAIDIPTADLAVAICRSGSNPSICTLGMDENGNPDRITALYATYQNISELRAEGVEVVANYTQDLKKIAGFLSGDLNVMINGSYVKTLSIALPDGTKRELSNWTGNTGLAASILGVPKWRSDAVVTLCPADLFADGTHVLYPEGFAQSGLDRRRAGGLQPIPCEQRGL